ncbi:efflux RND transporter periplasmic adaptor subunit [Stakelama sediminis]|uniref:RND family efflux transporter MFP subunit n=1 Tax=Stakelama sediminis TaxID=463200 RepID=A0A840YXT7_9SPHN|nr:efflux RND transporter periplasmic adaptor subunit [Stakelama sediminis]MBB5718367.1 RND family efflux transporter MFP subunit [Stakelama sediminis]
MNYETGSLTGEEHRYLPDPDAQRSRRRLWIVVVILALVLAGAAAYFMTRSKGGVPAPDAASSDSSSQIPTITVGVPGRSVVTTDVSGTGSLAARVQMPIGVAGEGGRVTNVLVQPGDWVKAGQVLATVDRSVQTQTADSLAGQVRAAQADAKLAQSELDRAEKLVDDGFISKATLDQKTATRDAALAKVRVAQAQLRETQARNARLDIRAPAAGLVLTRNVEPGQIVSSGSGVLFQVAKGGAMEMLAQLSEGDLAQVHVGAQATVTPVGTNDSFTGQVWQVSPVIDPQTRQGIARIALSYNRALRPGGFASATIKAGAHDLPMLPESAVLSDNDGNYVYIINDRNEVVRRPVKVGQVSDTGASIASGLNGTERVVLNAGAFLNPGQKVNPVLKALKNQKAGS